MPRRRFKKDHRWKRDKDIDELEDLPPEFTLENYLKLKESYAELQKEIIYLKELNNGLKYSSEQNEKLRERIVDLADLWDGKESSRYGIALQKVLDDLGIKDKYDYSKLAKQLEKEGWYND